MFGKWEFFGNIHTRPNGCENKIVGQLIEIISELDIIN